MTAPRQSKPLLRRAWPRSWRRSPARPDARPRPDPWWPRSVTSHFLLFLVLGHNPEVNVVKTCHQRLDGIHA
jgi:hypothetical protein